MDGTHSESVPKAGFIETGVETFDHFARNPVTTLIFLVSQRVSAYLNCFTRYSVR